MIEAHIRSSKHIKGKEKLASKEARERDISDDTVGVCILLEKLFQCLSNKNSNCLFEEWGGTIR